MADWPGFGPEMAAKFEHWEHACALGCSALESLRMFNLSPLEIGVIGVVVVLLFGTRKLPELGTGLGKAISNFRKSYKEGQAIDVTSADGEGAGEKAEGAKAEKKDG